MPYEVAPGKAPSTAHSARNLSLHRHLVQVAKRITGANVAIIYLVVARLRCKLQKLEAGQIKRYEALKGPYAGQEGGGAI